MTLAVIQTHPIQYYAPVYRHLEQQLGVPTVAIYATDASLVGYEDLEFGERVAWDVDLTSGYRQLFLGHQPLERLSARGLPEALRAVDPHAVLLTGYSPRFNLLSVLAACRFQRPLLMRADASDTSHARAPLTARLRDAVLRRLYRRIDGFCYVGHNALAHYRRLGVPESRLTFSPLSVSDATFRPMAQARELRSAARARLGIDENACVVLFSGKLIRKKSPDHLLAAAARLGVELRRKLTLLFMGDGALRGALEDAARAPGAPQVRMLGFTNQSRLSEHYHACDLLALPSLYRETWGLVVNEAMMHGKPCLVSDRVGCAPDLIEAGVTGYVHRHGDIEDLAARLSATIALSADARTTERCRERVAGYSTARSAEGIRDALARVAPGALGA